MLVYIVVAILLIVPLFFKQEQSNHKYDGYYWFEFCVLFLLMGLRFRVGGDSLRYEMYFSYAKDLSELFVKGAWDLSEGFQPLWTLYQAACKTITDDFVIVQLVNSFVLNGVIFYCAAKEVRHRFTFVVLYYFLYYPYFNTEIMRESLAVAMFIVGYRFLVNGNYVKYYLICVVAFMFHASAIFLMVLPVMYPFMLKSRGWKSYLVPIVFALVVSYYVSFILEILNSTLFLDNALLGDKSESVLQSEGLNVFGIIGQFAYLFPLFFCMYIFQKRGTKSNLFILNMYFFVSIIGMVYLPLVRLANYFIIPFLYIYSDMIVNQEILRKYRPIVNLSVCLLLYSRLSYYCQGMASTEGRSKEFYMYERYIPYHSVFDKEYDTKRERAIELQF